MQPTIRILDIGVANQIAAGEVIERPANIVKELVENAIDAQATSITVELSEGGIELIRVIDDGHGMIADDVRCCVRRHATSKLESEADLWALSTLGFRGEALPSIASVSHFAITSRHASAQVGVRLQIEGGVLRDEHDEGRGVGTTVEVSRLFFNVPARRKFLKSAATEATHITEACAKLALSRPGLRLRLVKDGRALREWLPAADREAKVKHVWPRLELFSGYADQRDIKVEVLVSAMTESRPGTSGLCFFVNDRPIYDRSLYRAVAFGYGDNALPGRYPCGAVWIQLPSSEVDINVHPQKTEVRFVSPRDVMQLVTRAVSSAVRQSVSTGTDALSTAVEWARSRPMISEGVLAQSSKSGGFAEMRFQPRSTSSHSAQHKTFTIPYVPKALATLPDVAPQVRLREERGSTQALVSQSQNGLIIFENEHGLHIVNAHVADVARQKKRLGVLLNNEGAVPSKPLLIPARWETTADNVAWIEAHSVQVRVWGFDCAALGPSSIVIRGIPDLTLNRPSADVLAHLMMQGAALIEEPSRLLDLLASFSAVQTGERLSVSQCTAIIEGAQLLEVRGTEHDVRSRGVLHSVAWSNLTVHEAATQTSFAGHSRSHRHG